MNLGFLTGGFRIPSRRLLAVILLSSSTLAWFLVFFVAFNNIFSNVSNNTDVVFVGYFVFLGFLILSAVGGSFLSTRFKQRNFLFFWMVFGLLVTAFMVFSQYLGLIFFFMISMLLGFSVGLGFPSALAFISDSTVIEERARVSGIVIFMAFLIAIPVSAVALAFSFGLTLVILLCAVRAIGFFALSLDSCDTKTIKEQSKGNIRVGKDFISYLFPWLLFSLTGGVISLVWSGLPQSIFGNAITIGTELHFLGWAIFGLLSGLMADRFGRKQPIIIGLALLGVSFAILGLVTTPLSVIIYFVFSGVAWGFLFTVYIAVLGDLAFPGSRERVYAFGGIVPLIVGLSFSAISVEAGFSAPAATLSSVLSILLFVSILPILRASETLPKKKMRSRQMKEHLDKVGELVEEFKKPDSS